MRRYYLDNIRFCTVLLVLIYHVFYMFNHVGVLGAIGSIDDNIYADAILYFVYPWFMLLLFLVSGMCARFALDTRTAKKFIAERTNKLLVPSTIGLLVFQWIGGYFNVKIGGGLDTIPAPVRYPIFALSGTGPLWFIQMLYLFSLLLVLIKIIDKGDRFWKLCGKCNAPVALLFVIPLWGASQILNLPVLTTYRFGIYLFGFLLGYFVFSHDELVEKIAKLRFPLLISAAVLGVAYTIFYFGKNYTADECLKSFFTNAYAWVAILAILACSKTWFDKSTRVTEFLSKSSFGVYILHYPVLLATCYALTNFFALPSFAVYSIALVLEIVLSFALYAVIKRIPIVRYLILGIKK